MVVMFYIWEVFYYISFIIRDMKFISFHPIFCCCFISQASVVLFSCLRRAYIKEEHSITWVSLSPFASKNFTLLSSSFKSDSLNLIFISFVIPILLATWELDYLSMVYWFLSLFKYCKNYYRLSRDDSDALPPPPTASFITSIFMLIVWGWLWLGKS